MVLSLLLVAVLGLTIHLWAWRRHNIALHGVQASATELNTMQNRYSGPHAEEHLLEAGSTPVMELPPASARLSEAPAGVQLQELQSHSALQELPGSDARKGMVSDSRKEKRESALP